MVRVGGARLDIHLHVFINALHMHTYKSKLISEYMAMLISLFEMFWLYGEVIF